VICLVAAAGATAIAQQAGSPDGRALVAREQAGNARFVVETRVTRGAPYSADAVSEFVQVLSDGNRIVRKTTTRLVRDSEGRTRRETIGANGAVENVVITDPVSGNNFVLDPANRSAMRGNGAFAVMAGARGGRGSANTAITVTQAGGATWTATARDSAVEVTDPAKIVAARGGRGEGQTSREDLGEQTIEGVTATGSRTTTTIAAGAVGNEQPIMIVSEQWYSSELQMLILTKHNDPRVGETIYRVTNIARSEPDQSLFQMPADYTVRSPQ
jgi:hypothetical protein